MILIAATCVQSGTDYIHDLRPAVLEFNKADNDTFEVIETIPKRIILETSNKEFKKSTSKFMIKRRLSGTNQNSFLHYLLLLLAHSTMST